MTEPLFLKVQAPAPKRNNAALDPMVERRLTQAISDGIPDLRISPAALAATLVGILRGQSIVVDLRPSLSEPDRLAAMALLEQVVRVSGSLAADRRETAIADLAKVILPDQLADARGPLALDNLTFRDEVLADTPSLTGVEVGQHAGQGRSNPYATAARWKRSGAAFAVAHRGKEWFPAFQFLDGRPHPTIKKVLAALPAHFSPWQRLAWFVSTNGWINHDAPRDRLDAPDRLVEAARHESEPVMG